MDFEEVYQRYFKDVYRFLRSLTQDEVLAEELTQETFFKALKGVDRFDGAKDIRAWLFTIARNTYYSYCRAHKITISMEELTQERPDSVRIEDRLTDRESAFAIHQYLHTMAEPYKEVFTLRIFGELPYEKIGQLFGKSAGWARVVFYRAKRQITEYLEANDDERN